MKKSLVVITENGEKDFSLKEIETLSEQYHPEIYSCDRALEAYECISMAYSGQVLAIEGSLAPPLDDELIGSLPFLEKVFVTEPVPYISENMDIPFEIVDSFSAVSLAEESLFLLLQLLRGNQNVKPRELHGLTAGIVGLSPASIYLTKLLGAHGMNVLYHDSLYQKSSIGVSMDFFEVISRADCIFVCKNTGTSDILINDEACKIFKMQSYLISLANLSMIDFPSVFEAMRKDIITGFASLKSHFRGHDDVLNSSYNIVVSSHSSVWSVHTRKAMAEEFVHKLTLIS